MGQIKMCARAFKYLVNKAPNIDNKISDTKYKMVQIKLFQKVYIFNHLE